MQDVVRRLEDGSLKQHISQVIPFNMAVGILNSLDKYSCGKTVVKMDPNFKMQLTSWTVSSQLLNFCVHILQLAVLKEPCSTTTNASWFCCFYHGTCHFLNSRQLCKCKLLVLQNQFTSEL